MQYETIILKGYHDNNNTTYTDNTINIGEYKHERMQLRDVKQNRWYTIHDINIYVIYK